MVNDIVYIDLLSVTEICHYTLYKICARNWVRDVGSDTGKILIELHRRNSCSSSESSSLPPPPPPASYIQEMIYRVHICRSVSLRSKFHLLTYKFVSGICLSVLWCLVSSRSGSCEHVLRLLRLNYKYILCWTFSINSVFKHFSLSVF